MLPTSAVPASTASQIEQLLTKVRNRTELLLSTVSEEQATTQHSPLMSPLVWDLGHVAAFETLWLQDQLAGEIAFAEMPGTYDPFEHPRDARGKLPLPTLATALDELRQVRKVTLERLRDAPLESSSPSPLLRDGFVYRMVAQHEGQHQETMLQALQLRRDPEYPAPQRFAPPRVRRTFGDGEMAWFPGGDVLIGTDDRSAAYDNERPTHVVRLAPFFIDITPVTNGAYLGFVEHGGYADRRYWSEEGWRWLREHDFRSPQAWTRRDDRWFERDMDQLLPLDERRPVCHVSFHEAQAYARFVGKRLPTEDEWEAAATWEPGAGSKRDQPWGNGAASSELANVDQLTFAPAPVGAYEVNVSPIGCYGMIGDVWEWTDSDFAPYPGFEAFPYREYSEVFFGGDYKVLRGGSWATPSYLARPTFRNWDYPIRRQIFSGFRCARDV